MTTLCVADDVITACHDMNMIIVDETVAWAVDRCKRFLVSQRQIGPKATRRLRDIRRVARVGEALPQIDAYERLSSICSCVNMEVLEANDNYLETLPTRLGDMKRLKSLRYGQLAFRSEEA